MEMNLTRPGSQCATSIKCIVWTTHELVLQKEGNWKVKLLIWRTFAGRRLLCDCIALHLDRIHTVKIQGELGGWYGWSQQNSELSVSWLTLELVDRRLRGVFCLLWCHFCSSKHMYSWILWSPSQVTGQATQGGRKPVSEPDSVC